jgi:hypothetical protein
MRVSASTPISCCGSLSKRSHARRSPSVGNGASAITLNAGDKIARSLAISA